MIKILKIEILEKHHIKFEFDDGSQKVVNCGNFIKNDPLTSPLNDEEYFCSVKIFENGRGIYWPNGYDFCPDNLRYYVPADEDIHLKQLAVFEKPNRK